MPERRSSIRPQVADLSTDRVPIILAAIENNMDTQERRLEALEGKVWKGNGSDPLITLVMQQRSDIDVLKRRANRADAYMLKIVPGLFISLIAALAAAVLSWWK